MPLPASSASKRNVRAADAKEVGVGNPAEETCCHPNTLNLSHERQACQQRIFMNRRLRLPPFLMVAASGAAAARVNLVPVLVLALQSPLPALNFGVPAPDSTVGQNARI